MRIMNVEEIAHRLGGASKSGDEWSCRCPAHEDRKASLSITERDGKTLFHCHAGCPQDAVLSELKNRGLLSTSKSEVQLVRIALPSTQSKIVAEYNYLSEDGELLYQAVRYAPKTFRQRRPDGKGGWINSLGDSRRVIYRLPEVIKAVAEGRTIFICEGEKDVEAAESLGLVATCNPMGADNGSGNKWKPEFADWLIGASVVVVPDQDEPGLRHGDWVIQTLIGKAAHVGRIDVSVGKDLSDWVNAGVGADELVRNICEVGEVKPIEVQERESLFVSVGDLVGNLQPIRWLVEDYVEEDSLALVFGAPGGGKSFITVDLACCIATGTPWHGHAVKQGAVFYIAGEGHNGLARRFAAWQERHGVSLKGVPLYKSKKAIGLFDEKAAEELHFEIVNMIEEKGVIPAMVIVDTVARNFGDGEENSTSDMGKFINNIDENVRVPFHCNVMLVHHSGHGMDRARGSSALKAALDAEYRSVKTDKIISMTCEKMKDAEPPPEIQFELQSVDLGEVEGQQITSCVLHTVTSAPLDTVLVSTKNRDGVDEKKSIKDFIKVIQEGSTSQRDIAADLAISKSSAKRALETMEKLGYWDGKSLTQDALNAYSLTGANLQRKGSVAPWKDRFEVDKDDD